jgi:hypothetical protein
MGQLFRLEEFKPVEPLALETDPFEGLVPEADVEAARLEGHDRGYRSGWDDAIAAADKDRTRVGAELARNLQDLSFSYHEARAHVLRGIEPLLEEILGAFLPASMREALGRTILDELTEHATAAADAPVQVMVSPGDAAHLQSFLAAGTTLPLDLVEEKTLPEGQVYLRLGQVERNIDLSGTLARMTEALRAASDLNARTLKHG